MQISAQTGNALLCECLFKCAKILYDFKRDLETILPSCKLNTDAYQTSFIVTFKQSDFDSAISKNLFANLITSYERNRLKEEIFRTKSKVIISKPELALANVNLIYIFFVIFRKTFLFCSKASIKKRNSKPLKVNLTSTSTQSNVFTLSTTKWVSALRSEATPKPSSVSLTG